MTTKNTVTGLGLALLFLPLGCSPESTEPPKPNVVDSDDQPTKRKVEKPYKDPKDLMKPPAGATPLAMTQTKFAKDLPGLSVKTRREGSGEALKYGDVGRFHLVVSLSNGKIVVDTRATDAPGTEAGPRSFAAIEQGKLKGLALGVVGMKKGEVRTLIIPAELAYGKDGDYMQAIPENATLSVRAELVEVLGPMVYVWKPGKEGAAIQRGQTGRFDYTGVLAKDGKQFDSSRQEAREPFQTPLQMAGENPNNPNGVIEGWVLGFSGMKVGERRWLRIPANLGYGAAGQQQAGIPPNADLIFEAELIEIVPG